MALIPPVWTYLVADLRTNAILDELPLTGVNMEEVLNDSAGTLTATWNLAQSERRNAYNLTTPARTAIYALRDGAPFWGGIIWTRAYDSSQQAVSLGVGDFGTYFDHRKVLPLLGVIPSGNTSIVANVSTQFIGEDQNDIARALVAQAQTHTGGDIGIQLDDSASAIFRDRTYFGYELGGVMDTLKLLAGLDDGPDFMFSVGGTAEAPTRRLILGDPHLGDQGAAHVWEYGGNLLAYTWPSDGTQMATRTFAVGDGIELSQLITKSEDAQRYVDGWPLLEAETGYTTVTDGATLQAHSDADLISKRVPVVLPTLTVHQTLPPFLADYACGDNGRMIVQDRFFTQGVDIAVRIVRRRVQPDSGTGEQVTLTCQPVLDEVF